MKVTTISSTQHVSVRECLLEIWNYRSLIWAFASRDLKVKYYQTVFGPLWVLFTPLITVGVMTFVFGLMIKVPSDNLPYLIFYMVAIVPWFAFTAVFYATMSSLEANASLLTKIYFPRLVLGFSHAVTGAIDFFVGFVTSVLLAFYFGVLSVSFILAMPFLLLIQMFWAMGLGLWLAPYSAKFRDVKLVVPLMVQIYYFGSPVLYPISVAPEWLSWIYSINPLAVVITAYRSLLNGTPLDWMGLFWAVLLSLGMLSFGAYVFMRKERAMVDVL